MSIYPENAVRRLYTVNANHPASVHISGKKVYWDYQDAMSKLITTDVLDMDKISRIVISKPKGAAYKTFEMTMPTPVVGQDYIIYFHFINWNGFGLHDQLEKFAVVHATSVINTAAKLAAAFVTRINKQFPRSSMNPFDITSTAEKLTLVEKEDTVNESMLLRGILPSPVDVTITTNAISNAGESWCVEAAGNNGLVPVKSTAVLNNSYLIWDMENFFSKGDSDQFGLVGFPDVNPTTMVTQVNKSDNYYVLDIHYYYDDNRGRNSVRIEKDLSFAAIDKAMLVALISTFTSKLSSALGAEEAYAVKSDYGVVVTP